MSERARVVRSSFDRTAIKRVAYVLEEVNAKGAFTGKETRQLQLIKPDDSETWVCEVYDRFLNYLDEEDTGCKEQWKAIDWMKNHHCIMTGLPVDVYQSQGIGDCTNGGISSKGSCLYLIDRDDLEKRYPFEPEDIRECVYTAGVDIDGTWYSHVRPLYKDGIWYMMGGNFVWTSDSRYKEITGIRYPLPIHDRYEGGKQ